MKAQKVVKVEVLDNCDGAELVFGIEGERGAAAHHSRWGGEFLRKLRGCALNGRMAVGNSVTSTTGSRLFRACTPPKQSRTR